MTDERYDVEVQHLFDQVIHSVGSPRRAAFGSLRELPQLARYRDQFELLAGLDKESTDFESRLRELQRRAHSELPAAVSRDEPSNRPLPER